MEDNKDMEKEFSTVMEIEEVEEEIEEVEEEIEEVEEEIEEVEEEIEEVEAAIEEVEEAIEEVEEAAEEVIEEVKMTIGLLGLWNSKNLGDPLLCMCAEKLLVDDFDGVAGRRIDIALPKDSVLSNNYKLTTRLVEKSIQIVKKNRFLKNKKVLLRDLQEQQMKLTKVEERYGEYYEEVLKDVDVVVFIGGGLLKFKQQKNISIALYSAVKYAERHNIPVMFHACGVEGYDAEDKGCQRIQYIVDSYATKMITTRDDFETLTQKYKAGEKTEINLSIDSAVYASEMMGIEKREESRIVGIGIARANLFKEYGFTTTERELIDLYKGIIKSVERRGEKWQLFTNGFKADYRLAKKILQELKAKPTHLVRLPKNPEVLVRQISSYGAVVAMRLHSCIIAYSLDIPVVGLCWNDKVKQFGDYIGYPDRFYYESDFDPEVIAKKLFAAMEEGYEQDKREEVRNTVKNSAKRIHEIYWSGKETIVEGEE